MKERITVIVTGASRGVGAAVARRLGETGAAVGVVARTDKALADVAEDVKRLGGLARPIFRFREPAPTAPPKQPLPILPGFWPKKNRP
jgi:NAD(P)-dependent dehydrogenase (short-subunit alcohol dehydrogenase family)